MEILDYHIPVFFLSAVLQRKIYVVGLYNSRVLCTCMHAFGGGGGGGGGGGCCILCGCKLSTFSMVPRIMYIILL